MIVNENNLQILSGSMDQVSYGAVEQSISPSSNSQNDNELNIHELILLTVALVGMQFTWTVELAYGTPYLISLGMPKPILSIVWLAGPLSGLIVQPVIGCISDKSTSKYGRRRPFILIGYSLVLFSMICIAYTKEIVSLFLNEHSSFYLTSLLGLAALGFYILDFSINAVQACLRALVIDIAPLKQQELANAYASRMIGVGNIIGYLIGTMDLPSIFPYLGDSQMKVLCALAAVLFGFTIGLTCVYSKEKQYEDCHEEDGISYFKFTLNVFKRIFKTLLHLPSCIQSICNVQIFAWIGWFPFLFYITTWIAEVLGRTQDKNRRDFYLDSAKAGSFALFLYSIVSLVATFILPFFIINEVTEHERLNANDTLVNTNCNNAEESSFLSCLSIINIRMLFALSNFLFGFLMLSTYFAVDIKVATVIIAMAGIPWAVMMWAPFSIIGEFTRILVNKSSRYIHQLQLDSSIAKDPCLSLESQSSNNMASDPDLDVGLVLGVHNIYIVLPQFLANFLSSIVFYFMGENFKQPNHDNQDLLALNSFQPRPSEIFIPYIISDEGNMNYLTSNSTMSSVEQNKHIYLDLFRKPNVQHEPVGFILFAGGLSSLVAGVLALRIPSPYQIS